MKQHEDSLEATPPEFVLKLLWLWQNWRRRWRLLLAAGVVISVPFLWTNWHRFWPASEPTVVFTRIRVAEQDCFWVNDYGTKNSVAGFTEIRADLSKWMPLDEGSSDQQVAAAQLLGIHKSLMTILNERPARDALPDDVTQSAHFVSLVTDALGPFQVDYFQTLRGIWPSEEELNVLKRQNPEAYKSVSEFRVDLLRTTYPVFDIIIKNDGPGDTIVHMGLLDSRQIKASFVHPLNVLAGAIPRGTLEVDAVYEWTIHYGDDRAYLDWVQAKQQEANVAFASDGEFIRTYSDVVSSRHELDPPLSIPAGDSVRIRLSLKGFSRSEIRFGFVSDSGTTAYSEWFAFNALELRDYS